MNATELGTFEGRRRSWISKRDRNEQLRNAGLDPAAPGVVSDYLRAMNSAAGETARAKNLQRRGEIGPAPYFMVTCEHCNGKGVGHCCPTGSYDDPADTFELVVSSRTAAEAITFAKSEFAHQIEDVEPCVCGRNAGIGTNDWWGSIAFHVKPLAAEDV